MQTHPDRRSVISLSVILIAAIAFGITTLILAPRFFAGEFRGSYHYWLITARLIVWLGAAMLLPALIFFRARRFALATLMLLLSVAFIILGNRWAMQVRIIWDAGAKHYYGVHSNLYLPPLNSQLYFYLIECDSQDRQCLAEPLGIISDAGYYEWRRDSEGEETIQVYCSRLTEASECIRLYQFPSGRFIPIMPDP